MTTIHCEKCRALIIGEGEDRTAIKPCPEGCCRLWCCPDCGEEWASDGPVGCPSCDPISRWSRLTLTVYAWLIETYDRLYNPLSKWLKK